MTIRLGPFELYEPIGRGGMATVWRGAHRDGDVPVAIKVMTADETLQEDFVRAFREEVRAVARLRHPGIIMILDSGEVDPVAAEVSEGRLIAGSPYLVMELGRGTLEGVGQPGLSFGQQRTILLRLLDALAHAHARGVIHRDLKPANVLIVSDGDGPSLKIADFGLAHALDEEQAGPFGDRMLSGTPRFVAPEQILGRWRDQGPWTDLYALGCVAYWLACGDAPFHVGDTERILNAHLSSPLPSLPPAEDRPPGYDRWLKKLLAKNWRDRFHWAADAAHGLRALSGEANEKVRLTLQYDGPGLSDLPDHTELIDETLILPEMDRSRLLTQELSGEFHRPPLPEDWRPGALRGISHDLIGAGLGLFGLRSPPMVGRQEERDLVWETLLQVERSSATEVVILQGPRGTGKSRLAEWICERAHQVGGASLVEIFLGPMVGPGEALSRAVATFLRCAGLSRPEILERVQDFFGMTGELESEDLFECLALTELIAETAVVDDDKELQRIHFSDAQERYGTYARFFERLATYRPVVVFFDDAHYSADVLRFVHHFLNHQGVRTPVLFVLTAREEDLTTGDEETELLQALQNSPSTKTLELFPLEEGEHLQIVRGLLHLDDGLSRDVARRTSGNPLFAVQLISDWVARGALVSGPGGYRLKEGEETRLPDEMHLLLRQRLDAILRRIVPGREEDAMRSLELAAVLGRSVDMKEWQGIAENQRAMASPEAIEALIAAGLARRSSVGFIFVHDALRETLLRNAAEHQRLRDHHRACAKYLAHRYSKQRPGLSTRLSRHLIEAGQLREALDPLLEAASQAQDAAEATRAHRLLDWREEALDELGYPEDHDERVIGWLRRARIYNQEEDNLIARMLLSRVEDACQGRDGADLILNEVRYTQGIIARDLGEHGTATEKFHEALEGFRKANDWLGVAKCTHVLGYLHVLKGEFEAAEACFHESFRHFEAQQNLRGMGLCHHGLAVVCNRGNDIAKSLDHLLKAFEYFDGAGDRVNLANVMNSIGEVYRYRGEMDRAVAHYRRSINTRKRLGSGDFVPSFNLVLTLIAADRHEEAADELYRLLEEVPLSKKVYVGLAHCGLLACLARTRQWKQWRTHFNAARTHLTETAFVDRDVAFLLKEAARACDDARRPVEFRQVATMAAEQWESLGDEEPAEAMRRWLQTGEAPS